MKNTSIIDSIKGIDSLWTITKGSSEVVIAVLDGPVDTSHEALNNSSIQNINSEASGKVRSFHGTFVTSLIFSDHSFSVKGIAPGCKGLIKTIYHENSKGELHGCSQADIAQGIFDALDNYADIINISGGERLNHDDHIMPVLLNALEQCERRGVLVIAATGNEGDEHMHVPANYPTVLAVGSMDSEYKPSGFSNWTKSQVKHGVLVAGENILGAMPEGYPASSASLEGTSFSTALLSGIAGLLASAQIQQGSAKDLLAVRKAILSTVIPCTAEEGINCDRVLAGRLNLPAAMDAILTSTNKHTEVNDASVTPASITQYQQPLSVIANDTPLDPTLDSFESGPITLSILKEPIMSNETQVQPASTVEPSSVVETGSAVQASVASPESAGATPSAVEASACACTDTGAAMPSVSHNASFNPTQNQGCFPTFENCQLVTAIGQPSYDFGIVSNLDTFTAYMETWYAGLPAEMQAEFTNSPYDHASMAAFLLFKDSGSGQLNAFMSSQLIWLLDMNATPVYSITPNMAVFNDAIYLTLAGFLADNVGLDVEVYSKLTASLKPGQKILDEAQKKQLKKISEQLNEKSEHSDDVMRMVLPGYISGDTQLMNRNSIQSVTPVAYGLADWTVNALVAQMDFTGTNAEAEKMALISILNRLYFNTLNKGQSPDDRALNYSIYNIIELSDIVKEAVSNKLQFSNFKVVPSKISRQHSISREVQLTFFDPSDTTVASTTYAMQIDVSGITPIMVGSTQQWQSPISVAAV